jgi:hypothetical protein
MDQPDRCLGERTEKLKMCAMPRPALMEPAGDDPVGAWLDHARLLRNGMNWSGNTMPARMVQRNPPGLDEIYDAC